MEGGGSQRERREKEKEEGRKKVRGRKEGSTDSVSPE